MFKQEASLDALLNRKRPSFWSRFWESPFVTLAHTLYTYRQSTLTSLYRPADATDELPITVVCTSDTHNSQPVIPAGDLFIHAGDLSQGGTKDEIQAALNWINALPHKFKIVIAGNHDMYLDCKLSETKEATQALDWGSIIYLQDTSTVLQFEGGRCLSVYGTPHTRKHGSWGFQFSRDVDMFSNTIPEDTDILISHSPPRFHRDVAGWGDDHLLGELWRVKPKLHIFGHVHEGYGKDILKFDEFQRLYEQVCRHNVYSNTWRLMKMVAELFTVRLLNRDVQSGSTVAINPAAVGGLRDTQRRDPLVATI